MEKLATEITVNPFNGQETVRRFSPYQQYRFSPQLGPFKPMFAAVIEWGASYPNGFSPIIGSEVIEIVPQYMDYSDYYYVGNDSYPSHKVFETRQEAEEYIQRNIARNSKTGRWIVESGGYERIYRS